MAGYIPESGYGNTQLFLLKGYSGIFYTEKESPGKIWSIMAQPNLREMPWLGI